MIDAHHKENLFALNVESYEITYHCQGVKTSDIIAFLQISLDFAPPEMCINAYCTRLFKKKKMLLEDILFLKQRKIYHNFCCPERNKTTAVQYFYNEGKRHKIAY